VEDESAQVRRRVEEHLQRMGARAGGGEEGSEGGEGSEGSEGSEGGEGEEARAGRVRGRGPPSPGQSGSVSQLTAGRPDTAASDGSAASRGSLASRGGDWGVRVAAQWVREGPTRRQPLVEIDGMTGRWYVPTADDVGKRVGVRVSFPGSFAERLVWTRGAVEFDRDAAAVLTRIVENRHAAFPIRVRGKTGEAFRCTLEVTPDRIKIVGRETEVKDRWRGDFKALVVPGKPDAVVLQLRKGSVVALNCSPAERDLLVLCCRNFWAGAANTWDSDLWY